MYEIKTKDYQKKLDAMQQQLKEIDRQKGQLSSDEKQEISKLTRRAKKIHKELCTFIQYRDLDQVL